MARVSAGRQILLCDAQTSGGLLIVVSPDRAGSLEARLTQQGTGAWQIGELVGGAPGHIDVV
jgi:selenide,water dikinase